MSPNGANQQPNTAPSPDLAKCQADLDDAVRLLRDARDSVEECVQEHAAAWGERLMSKQLDAITNLREIDAFLARVAK